MESEINKLNNGDFVCRFNKNKCMRTGVVVDFYESHWYPEDDYYGDVPRKGEQLLILKVVKCYVVL